MRRDSISPTLLTVAPYFTMIDTPADTTGTSRREESSLCHSEEAEEGWLGSHEEHQAALQHQSAEFGMDMREDTDALYDRIMELSDNIQQKLEESTGSYRKPISENTLPVTGGDNCVGSREMSGCSGGLDEKVSSDYHETPDQPNTVCLFLTYSWLSLNIRSEL